MLHQGQHRDSHTYTESPYIPVGLTESIHRFIIHRLEELIEAENFAMSLCHQDLCSSSVKFHMTLGQEKVKYFFIRKCFPPGLDVTSHVYHLTQLVDHPLTHGLVPLPSSSCAQSAFNQFLMPCLLSLMVLIMWCSQNEC